MDLKEERQADVAILAIGGRVDAANAKQLQEAILRRIEDGARRLVVDLSRMDYISSAGLRAFLMAAKRKEGEDGKMVLCSMNEDVRRVFDLPGASSIFTICNSREEALKTV